MENKRQPYRAQQEKRKQLMKKGGADHPKKQQKNQNRHQTVNANVNSDGGGSSHKPQVHIHIPSTILDPSSINPQYGVNDRQPTNPLTNSDPSMDLMTLILPASQNKTNVR